jgi:serine/threonine protein kinase/tetratricopeptide (TPR) repeat protein
MGNVSSVCERCGAEIVAGAPAGVCTACLFETGLDLLANDDQEAKDRKQARQSNGAMTSEKVLSDFGDYQLLKEIGRGGQGVVYRARQKSLNRTVALKVIGLGHWATEAHLRRFRLEAEAAASLNHPCIVPIYDIGERDGSCYFSMGLVEGGQLDQVIEQEPMPPRRPAELIAKLARTVYYAHEHGILHRDIKPGNILLDAKGEPHLTDFGLARLADTESTVTRTLEVLGTPSYMAPEQARGNDEKITNATDIYGLGAVLYQLLTGHAPFSGGTTYETVRLLLETEPRQPRLLNPKVDRDLATICLKCLEKDPQQRYPSALALAEDLERWLKHEPIHARRTSPLVRGEKWVRRKPAIAAVIVLSLALVTAVGVIVWKSDFIPSPATTTGIAVLPFESLSSNKDDASFADGVQDDLLTKLANIADLKVISRTSVMEYRGKRNTRDIGHALQVSHVLEGSVRRTGTQLHINAQLIDARTDTHVWAKQYDGDLKEIFAIQSEIAQRVAEKLHAKISDAEEKAIKQPPTADLTAFDLYTRAKNLLLAATFRGTMRANLLQAVDLLNEAVVRDPSFLQAYSQLAWAHDQLYWFGFDHTAARLALAEAAVQAASRLFPDAGETHLARAQNLYRGYLDYDGALSELELARRTLPNDPRIFQLTGYIQRRQGHWEESTRNLERAVELDPRNLYSLQQIAVTYGYLRRYSEQRSAYDRALAVHPNDVETKVLRAFVDMDAKADTHPLHQTIDSIRARNLAALPSIVDNWLVCALAERDEASAKAALLERGDSPVALSDDNVPFNHPFIEGVIARTMNDNERAHVAFTAAGIEQEKTVQAQPNYGPALCVLGLIDAALGRKEEALREGRRAVELLPVEKDAINGPRMIAYSAMIAAWAGDKDLACEQLSIAIRYPGSFSYGQLKLLPFWDPLRGDPRFEKALASLAPKRN